MSKTKKIVLSLCVAFATLIAFVVGIVCFNRTNKANNSPQVEDDTRLNQGENSEPITYTFEAGEVEIVNGPNDIDFSYVADNASTNYAHTKAYEYTYGSTSDEKMVLDLKAISSDNVIISYAYSPIPLDVTDVIESSSEFTPYVLENNGDIVYAYILITPKDKTLSTNFTTNVTWHFGKAGELIIINGFDKSITTRPIAKGYPLDQPADIKLDNGYNFMGWYMDEDYSIPASFPFVTYGVTLYAKLPNLPSDCLSATSRIVDGVKVCNYEVNNTSASQLSDKIIVPKTYNNGVNGLGNVIAVSNGNTFGNQTGVTDIELPSTIETLGNNAFNGCSNLVSINTQNCTNLTTIESGVFAGCSSLEMVDISNSKIQTIKGFDYSGVKNINLPSTITAIHPQAFLSSEVKVVDLSNSNITKIPDNAFLNSKVEQVILPNTIISIGASAFEGCGNLTNINLNSLINLNHVGANAFKGCLSLNTIDLSNTKLETINSFMANSGVENIVLPTGVTSISSNAFKDCYSLTNVNFEQLTNLHIIGDNAFANSGVGGDIVMPEGLTTIGARAFDGCNNLKSVDLSNCDSVNISAGYIFANCKKLAGVVLPEGLTYLGQYMFSGCELLDNVTLPTSIRKLNTGVFQNCASLKTINLEQTRVSSILAYAFSGSGLTEVEFPSTLTSIGSHAFENTKISTLDMSKCNKVTTQSHTFSNCVRLSTILFPANQSIIGEYDFENCTAILSLSVPNTITTIKQYAFSGVGLRQLTLPNSITTIGHCAFQNCTSLLEIYNLSNFVILAGSSDNGCVAEHAEVVHTNINVQSMLQVEDGAMYYRSGSTLKLLYVSDKSATNITIKEGTTHIDARAFEYCKNLTTIEVPDSVVEIGVGAFQYCTSLEIVKLPANLPHVAKSLFEGCAKLINVALPQNVAYIAENAFNGCEDLETIAIPASVKSIQASAFNGCGSLATITFEEGLTTIANNAFNGCGNITTIKLPNTLTTIGAYAFSQTGLTRIVLPKNVVTIGEAVFADCTDLRSVDMTLCTGLMEISDKLFINGTSLVQMLLPTHEMIRLGESAFKGCSALENIVLPQFSCIALGAFDGCTNLTSVNMTGSWNIYSSLGEFVCSIDVANPNTNAQNLKADYINYYWYSV